MQRCVHKEVRHGNRRPASLLRWDTPAALYAGGRCVNPAGAESSLYPHPRAEDTAGDARAQQDRHGWRRHGFSGHNVTQAGIGWVFADMPLSMRDAAFGHDAWAIDPRFSSSRSGATELTPSHECTHNRQGSQSATRSAARYAQARYAAQHVSRYEAHVQPDHQQQQGPGDAALNALQRMASAFKFGFINTTWNCFHLDWEAALADQRAYASLLVSKQHELSARRHAQSHANASPATQPPPDPECSLWGSLYNQMHVSWTPSLLRAIFYVNDTHTPRRYPKGTDDWRTATKRLHRDALAAAERAHSLARLAQQLVASEYNLSLPIVSYVYSDECSRGDRMVSRLRDNNGSQVAGSGGTPRAVAAAHLFRVPPPPTASHGVSRKHMFL